MAGTYTSQIKRHNGTGIDSIYPITTWSAILSKPTTFTPTAHTHTISQITDITSASVATAAGVTVVTTAPTSANTGNVKIAVLSTNPATKYAGWLYFITE